MTIVSRCANDNDCGLWRSKVQLRASRSSSNALRQFVAAAIPPRSDPCSSSSSVAESSSREAGEVRTWVHQWWWWWWWWGPSGQLGEWSTCRQYCYRHQLVGQVRELLLDSSASLRTLRPFPLTGRFSQSQGQVQLMEMGAGWRGAFLSIGLERDAQRAVKSSFVPPLFLPLGNRTMREERLKSSICW